MFAKISYGTSDWTDIEELRRHIEGATNERSVEAAARTFVTAFTTRLQGTVLARMFMLMPVRRLPPAER